MTDKTSTLTNEILYAALSCPNTIAASEVVIKMDDKQEGHNAYNQLHRRIDKVVAGREAKGSALAAETAFAKSVLEEIERLRPHYQAEISYVDAGRRQMLDHFEKFIQRTAAGLVEPGADAG